MKMTSTPTTQQWSSAHQGDAARLLFSLLSSDPELSSKAACVHFVAKYGAAFSAASAHQGEQSIADYQMLKKIGRGQFGDVELCKHKASGELVAIKIVSKAEALQSANPGQALVEREVLAAAAELSSSSTAEGITRLKAAFQDDNFLYLVQEYLPGGDLFTLVDRTEDERLPEAHVKFYLAELVEALGVVHNLGYAHRDVKPENLLLDEAGHLKLADFGSASKLGSEHSAVTALATPDYTAPEVLAAIREGNATVAAAADFWSVGVVTFELLVGEMPFSAARETDTYANIMNHEQLLEIPAADEVDISAEARDLISQLLSPVASRLNLAGIKAHPFFAGVHWGQLRVAPKETVPTVPALRSKEDTSHFELGDLAGAGPRASLDSNPLIAMGASFAHGVAGLPFVGWTWTGAVRNTTAPGPAAAAAIANPTAAAAAKPAPTIKATEATEATAVKPGAVKMEDERKPQIDMYKQEENDKVAPPQQREARSKLFKRKSSRQLRRQRSLVDVAALSVTTANSGMPDWKAAVITAKREKARLQAEAERAKDPRVKYAHLPEWRQAMLLRKLAEANNLSSAKNTVLQTSG